MDPDATLRMIRDAVADGDTAEAAYLRKELRNAIKRGVREPRDPSWRSA
jgi:hypothetical protein